MKKKTGTTGKRVEFKKVLLFKEMREEGLTLRQIAERTHSSTATIMKYLRELSTMDEKENVT